MSKLQLAAILAAGHGTRLAQHQNQFKPFIQVKGEPLISRLLRLLEAKPFEGIFLTLNSQQVSVDLRPFASFQDPRLKIQYKETPSSMHTLWETVQFITREREWKGHLFVSLVDTILRDRDFERFLNFCSHLGPRHSAVLGTTFIDDEKPLTVEANSQGEVIRFGAPISPGIHVTSGMYCFSPECLPILQDCVNKGEMHLRRFLAILLERGEKISLFSVDKTVDIDRPEDIEVAERFIEG